MIKIKVTFKDGEEKWFIKDPENEITEGEVREFIKNEKREIENLFIKVVTKERKPYPIIEIADMLYDFSLLFDSKDLKERLL